MSLDLTKLKARSLPELLSLAADLNIDGAASFRKQDLIFEIMRKQVSRSSGSHLGQGVLEILPDGFGFLRAPEPSFLPGPDDIYVSPSQIRRFNLRTGDLVQGQIRAPKEGEKYFALLKIEAVNQGSPDDERNKPHFDALEVIAACTHVPLFSTPTLRTVDLVAPLALGHRVAIHAEPHAGRSTFVQQLIEDVEAHSPDVVPLLLLIDERPEDITTMSRACKAQVFSSTFDESPSRHVQVAEMGLERAKRLVEQGRDVVLVLDSLTRLTRAYAAVVPTTGRELYGAVDVGALGRARRFFGAGRRLHGAGSLTMVATVLRGTESEFNDILVEDLVGMANAEVHLRRAGRFDQGLPIDLDATETYQMDAFLPSSALASRQALWHTLSGDDVDPIDVLNDLLAEHSDNTSLLAQYRGPRELPKDAKSG